MFNDSATFLDFPVTSSDEERAPSKERVDTSRATAVSRVFSGSVSSLLGIGGIVGAVSTTAALSYVAGAIGSAFLGLGLGLIGSAAVHLIRYGKPRVALTLGATAGLGVSIVVWGLTTLAPVIDRFPLLYRLNLPATISVLGFATAILLLVLGAVLRWIAESETEAQG